VSTTTNPKHAYNLFCNYLLRNYPFDIVFLDYLLPPTNGITLGKKFRDLHSAVKLEFFASSCFNCKSIHAAYVEMCGGFKEPVLSFDQMEEVVNLVRREKNR